MLEGPRPCKISCFVLQSEGNKSCVLFTARDHCARSMPKMQKNTTKFAGFQNYSLYKLNRNQIILCSINVKLHSVFIVYRAQVQLTLG